MYERIIEVRKNFNLTQDVFASKIGLSRSAISNIENGNRSITERVISDICREFNISKEWLRTGEGDMFVEPSSFSLDEYVKRRGCKDYQIQIIKTLLELDEDTATKLIKAFKPVYDMLAEEEVTATIEATATHDLSIAKELEHYRIELEAAKKGTTSPALDTGKDKIS